MKYDFKQASRRHFDDADLLDQNNRVPNAGQLYGFAAECGVKAMLVAAGYPTIQDGDLGKATGVPYARVHLDKLLQLLSQLTTVLTGQTFANYHAQMPQITDFSDWNVAHRYCEEADIPPSLAKWKTAAKEVLHVLQNLQLNNP